MPSTDTSAPSFKPGHLGQMIDRSVAVVKTWPLEQQRSVDVRDPEYLRTLDTRVLEEGPDYLRPFIKPILDERGV